MVEWNCNGLFFSWFYKYFCVVHSEGGRASNREGDKVVVVNV